MKRHAEWVAKPCREYVDRRVVHINAEYGCVERTLCRAPKSCDAVVCRRPLTYVKQAVRAEFDAVCLVIAFAGQAVNYDCDVVGNVIAVCVAQTDYAANASVDEIACRV